MNTPDSCLERLSNQTETDLLNGTPFDILFGSPVNAAAIMMIAVNAPTELQAYDLYGNLLGSTALPVDVFRVNFVGFGGFDTQIASFRVNTSDAVIVDNLYFAPMGASVSEPGAMALIALGLVALGWSRRGNS